MSDPVSASSTTEPSDPFDVAYEPWSRPAQEPEHHFFQSDDGLKLHYLMWLGEREADANAPIILMVHGRRAHAHWFDPLVAELIPKHACASLDLRSHGDSASAGACGFERHAKDVADWVNLFSGRRVCLLAHSMAGRVAVLAHQAEGARPDALILADTPMTRKPHHFTPEPAFVRKHYENREQAIRRFRLMPPGTSADPQLLEYIAGHSVVENPDGSWSWKFDESGTSRAVGFKMPDFSELNLEAITCPTLVIHGGQSVLVSRTDAEAIGGRIKNSETVTIEGAYHHLMFDKPATFGKEIKNFLTRNNF